jgi:hypothetical protein
MTSRQASGALPTAQQMAALGLLQGSMAYKAAQQAALQGVDPDVAAQYGVAVSGYRMAYWMVFWITGFFALMAVGYGGVLTLWGLGNLAVLWLLHRRLKDFQKTDPRLRLRYSIPTGWVVSFALVWALLVPVGIMQAVVDSIPPRPPTIVHIQPAPSPTQTREV